MLNLAKLLAIICSIPTVWDNYIINFLFWAEQQMYRLFIWFEIWNTELREAIIEIGEIEDRNLKKFNFSSAFGNQKQFCFHREIIETYSSSINVFFCDTSEGFSSVYYQNDYNAKGATALRSFLVELETSNWTGSINEASEGKITGKSGNIRDKRSS